MRQKGRKIPPTRPTGKKGSVLFSIGLLMDFEILCILILRKGL